MIHILTVHYKSLDWIPIQYAHINNNVDNFKIWSFVDEVQFDPWPFEFDFHFKKDSEIRISQMYGHWRKLDKLVYECLANESDDDIVMFLDGDAFPVSPVDDTIRSSLDEYEFLAITRHEMKHRWPHPSFSCCRLGFWRKHNLTWNGVADPGTYLLDYFTKHDIAWKRMLRTHSLTWHPVMFGVYDGLVYHHSSAFRTLTTRWDRQNPTKTKPLEEREKESESVFNRVADTDFFKKLLKDKKS